MIGVRSGVALLYPLNINHVSTNSYLSYSSQIIRNSNYFSLDREINKFFIKKIVYKKWMIWSNETISTNKVWSAQKARGSPSKNIDISKVFHICISTLIPRKFQPIPDKIRSQPNFDRAVWSLGNVSKVVKTQRNSTQLNPKQL